jgi:hypothetical protein
MDILYLHSPSIRHLVRPGFTPFPISLVRIPDFRFQAPARPFVRPVAAMHSVQPANQTFRVFTASPALGAPFKGSANLVPS